MNKNFPVLLQSCRPGTGGLVQISNIDFAYIKHDYWSFTGPTCVLSATVHGPIRFTMTAVSVNGNQTIMGVV